MDSANSSAHQHQQQHQQQQQQSQQQQFCLRWHNHQTSLLSTLPLLLDQSHLTDVTLSAEGKTLRAHRVVLSACSSFFSELFRTLDSSHHPVIVIPGASFAAVVALLTFMYSGEVNVYEEQIPSLLAVAETLGVKGLADFQNNNPTKSSKTEVTAPKEIETPSPTLSKMPSPLENFFMKSFQFYPNLIPQPLNFSQSALNKTSEFLAKYHQNQCNLAAAAAAAAAAHAAKDNEDTEENINKRSCSGEKKCKEMKRIDKIAESLRTATSSKCCLENSASSKITGNITAHSPPGGSMVLKPPPFPSLPHHLMQDETAAIATTASAATTKNNSAGMECKPEQPHPPSTPNYNIPENLTTAAESILEKTISNPPHRSSNPKLYATCFICHKQLSNQYNLRVHLETHQNVRYACNVCSHVSRSKDALRKHVSYRHPGAPSPCESETRRKRSKTISTPFQMLKSEPNEGPVPQTPPPPPPPPPSSSQISNQPFMFLPNQFHPVNSPHTNSPPTSTPRTPTPNEASPMLKESMKSEPPESV